MSLTLWLDHDEQCAWAAVHERAMLRPVAAYLSNKRSLVASLSLPNLHPKLEREDRHFVQGSPAQVLLHRRIRQRHYGQLDVNGESEVVYKPDFPFLLELYEFYPEEDAAELEEFERSEWKIGQDMEEYTVSFFIDIAPGCSF